MKLGIYFDNASISEVDFAHPEKGNPGVGATQYLLASFPYYLAKYSPCPVECIAYASDTSHLTLAARIVKAPDLVAAAEAAHQDGCDVFLCLPPSGLGEMKVFAAIERLRLSSIMWANNTPSAKCLDAIHAAGYVKRLVCASREGMDFLRDHPVFSKTTFIFNGIDPDLYKPRDGVAKRPNTVLYMGSLVPVKGFHILASVWPSIRKKVRDAKLLVIGTADLYERGVPLGRWGIAQENYEQRIRHHLSGVDGRPAYGVQFLGRLGAEKLAVLQSAGVGVVNPSGRSEICPVSALEIQACGTPIVSTPKHGVVDTVISGETGLLGRGRRALEANIAYLLTHPAVAEKYGRNAARFVRETFAYETVMRDWHSLFRSVLEGRPAPIEPVRHLMRNLKIIREASRLLRSYLHLPIPSMVGVRDLVRELRR